MSDGCGVGIVGLGAGLPSLVRPNAWWLEHADAAMRDDFVRGVEKRRAARGERNQWEDDPFRGVVERRVLEQDRLPSDMEVDACRAALASAGVYPTEIDLLVGYSQVPDDAIPPNVGKVAHRLGLRRGVASFELDAGCASFLPQLTTAVRLIQAGDQRKAMLFQSSASSLITDYSRSSSVLVGDGAVSQVVAPVEPGLGFVGSVQLTRGELCEGIILARANGHARWWEGSGAPLVATSRDHEAAHTMGAQGPDFAREACELLYERCDVRPETVDFFVCAQAGAWFGEACARAAGIGPDKVVRVDEHFARFGHLFAASVSLNLWVAWNAGRLHKGELVLVYSPGVGFVQVATLIRWAMDPPAQS